MKVVSGHMTHHTYFILVYSTGSTIGRGRLTIDLCQAFTLFTSGKGVAISCIAIVFQGARFFRGLRANVFVIVRHMMVITYFHINFKVIGGRPLGQARFFSTRGQ